MTTFYMETMDDLSDRLIGTTKNGWPIVHPRFMVEAETREEAIKVFEARFPGNVMDVYEED